MEITKTQFKTQFESVLESLNQNNEDIIIMDNDKPLFRISKYQKSLSTKELFASLRGKVKYYEDVTTSTIDEWVEV